MFKTLKKKFAQLLQGRTSVYIFGFFVIGNILNLYHRLDGNYITFMATLMGLVLGHSVKEDLITKPVDQTSTPAISDPNGGDK